MRTTWDNLRYGFRRLIQRPVTTLVCVITLALGIGASTAMFSVISKVLIQPLPYANPEGLVAVWSTPTSGRERWTSAYPDYVDWDTSGVFERIAVYNNDRTILKGKGAPLQIVGTVASADLFPLLGVEPELGRTFTREEDQVGGAPVIVLSHDAWERYFGSDANVIGSVASIGDRSVTIIGIMPRTFAFPATRSQVDYYLPVAQAAGEQTKHRSDMFLRAVARLKSGSTVSQTQASLDGITNRLAATYPDTNASRGVWIKSLHDDLVGDTRPAVLLLFGSVGLLLLIACANVANLMLAAVTARRREIVVRAALGASRRRIAAQILSESALLALAGGVMGLLIAKWLLYVLLKMQTGAVPLLTSADLDWRVLLFAMSVVTFVTIAAALVPALYSTRVNLVNALRDGDRGSSEGRGVSWVRSALVITQVAISATILIASGLMLRSFIELRKVKPGFETRDVLTATLAPSKSRFKTSDERNLYFSRVLAQLKATPGVEVAACVGPIPFGRVETDTNFSIVGRAPIPKGQQPLSDSRVASAEYFQLMRIPVLRGREFSTNDGPQSVPVAIVNATFVKRFFPGEEPIGKQLIIGADPKDNPNPAPRVIIGVVGDAYHSSLEVPPGPEIYTSLMQDTWPAMDFVVRSRPGSTSAIAASMREAMRSADVDEYVAEPRLLSELLEESMIRHEFTVMLLGAFAAVALVLATIGLYAVMSHAVTRRTQEIGIRMALGAQLTDVLTLVIKQGMLMAVIGEAIGITSAFVFSRVMRGMLFGVAPGDAVTFISVLVLLTGVAFAACVLPARRAAKVDPLVALRNE